MPGIYQWEIEGVGIYIGKYSRVSGPRWAYGSNVLRLLREQPYQPSDPGGFRLIHERLAEAVLDERPVTLTFLENCKVESLLEREAWWIAQRGTLNGMRARRIDDDQPPGPVD